MAAKARTGGSMAIEYEDFQPKFEWKEEDWANILHIYLPAGFQKEQMKVSYIHSTRIVRVVGEQPLAYNKWSRFNQPFQVPQNCEVNKIQANFQNGVLTIKMPKAIVTLAPKQANATQEAPIPPPGAAPKTAGKEGSSDAKVIASQIPKRNSTDDLKPIQRGEALSFEQRESSRKRKESMTTTGSDEESDKKRKESMVIPGDDQGDAIKPLMQKEKGKNDDYKVSGAEEKQREDVNGRIAQKLKELKNVTAAAAKKTVQGLARELTSEERQSMVSMGVAVLVTAALGAYIYYSYRSSGTGGSVED